MLDWCSVLDQYSNISSSQECGGRHLMMTALLYQPRGLEQNSLGQLELIYIHLSFSVVLIHFDLSIVCWLHEHFIEPPLFNLVPVLSQYGGVIIILYIYIYICVSLLTQSAAVEFLQECETVQ